MDVLLVHGYNVTSTKTYGVLPQRLRAAGHRIKNIYLSKYVTLDNELTLPDIIKAFQAALEDEYGPRLEKTKFACITHSTGGLVVRGWISAYYSGRMKSLPLSHLILMASPNHGSRLASLGKSRLSRLRSLFGVEPGVQILDALAPSSGAQWELNGKWIEEETHLAPGFYPVAIAGQWIDKKIWDVVVPATYERGSDGVVRVPSANPNMAKFTVAPSGKIAEERMEGIPFLVTSQTAHSDVRFGIMAGIPSKGDHPVLSAILQSLDVADKASYKKLAADFSAQTESTQRTEKYYDGTTLDRYAQLAIRVTDDMGNRLRDYSIELIDAERRGDRFPTGFLAHSMQNDTRPEHFIYYFDYDKVSKVIGGKIGFRVHTVGNSPLVAYDEFYFEGPATEVGRILKPNQTAYVDVVLKRRLNKNVFRLTKNFSYQKIERKAGPDWIV